MKIIFTPFILVLLLGFLITVASCTSQVKTSSAASPPDTALLKCWTHAFEEDGQDNVRIFRSCMNHTFPMARYRNTFTLKENGDVEYSVLGENDAHSTENGKWAYDSGKKKLLISNSKGGLVKEYEVLELTEDLLRLKE